MDKSKNKRTFNKPAFIQAARDEWMGYTTKPNSILVMRYLQSEAGSRLNALKYRLKRGEIDEIRDEWWRVINPTNKQIADSLIQHGLVAWKSYDQPIARALGDLTDVGLIETHKVNARKRLIIVGPINHKVNHTLITKCEQNVSKMSLKCEQNVSKMSLNEDESKPENKDISEVDDGVYNIIEYKDTPDLTNTEEKSFKEPQIKIQEVIEDTEGKAHQYFLVSKDKTLVKSWYMNRSEEPNQWPDNRITELEDFILELGEFWGFTGGADNNKLDLKQWLNNPAHKELVAPWVHEDIHYTDFRDFPIDGVPETFVKYQWYPSQVEITNRVLTPSNEDTKRMARQVYGMYAQPFNNPYLSPDKKGLAFIRLFPFGFHVRDIWFHPWSPPLIPWAVVADDKEMLDKWTKKYWSQGFHPFQHDKTTQRIREAIAYGNRELTDDQFFDQARYDSLDVKPQSFAGARTSIIVNPGPFQLLHWYCGAIGVSPTVMIDAYKRWETYNGGFPGLNLHHKSNANADKIRVFANYLKYAMWGDAKKGSYLPREQGVQKALASGEKQEWSHQGVLSGTSVLVRCHDGQMREVWMTNYQKAIYDLKFNPKNERDKEILDSLLAELL